MDLRWLDAPDQQVVETMARLHTEGHDARHISRASRAMALARDEGRPQWMPTWRQTLLHVNNCLLLWAMTIAWFVLGVRIDTLQDNVINATDVRDMAVVIVVFTAWGVATYTLFLWSRHPPSFRARISEWRQQLTGSANGFVTNPTRRSVFSSLITEGDGPTLFHPRFTRLNVEFGNLTRKRSHKAQWCYLAVQLPVVLPHLILSSHRAGGIAKHLPVRVGVSQRLRLEGDFDTSFHAYAPGGYERDALFVLVPDVMAAFIDFASDFNIELVGDRVVFFAPTSRSFLHADTWRVMDDVISGALPPLVSAAVRYRDDRVPGQNSSLTVASILATLQSPDVEWREPERTVAEHGQRLKLHDLRKGWWRALGRIGWILSLAFLYVVPGSFLFAAIMSIIDGH